MIAYIVVGCVIGGGIAAIIVAFISAPVSLTTRIISHAASRDVRTRRMPYRVRLAGYAAGLLNALDQRTYRLRGGWVLLGMGVCLLFV